MIDNCQIPLECRVVRWKVIAKDAKISDRSSQYTLVIGVQNNEDGSLPNIDRFHRTESVPGDEYNLCPMNSIHKWDMYSADGKSWFFYEETARQVYATINPIRI